MPCAHAQCASKGRVDVVETHVGQAATSSGKPVLIRTESDAGHGIGSTRDQVYAERSDVYSFFLAVSGDWHHECKRN